MLLLIALIIIAGAAIAAWRYETSKAATIESPAVGPDAIHRASLEDIRRRRQCECQDATPAMGEPILRPLPPAISEELVALAQAHAEERLGRWLTADEAERFRRHIRSADGKRVGA